MSNRLYSAGGVFLFGLIAIGLLYLPLLDAQIMRHEEPRRALIAEAMIMEQEYLVPVFKEQVYAAKPPGYNWLIIAISAPFGEINEFTIRFSSLLCLIFLLATMLFLLRSYLDPPALTFLGAGIVLSPELMRKGTLGEIDMMFTFLVSSALWLWFYFDQKKNNHARWVLPGILIAIAFLTKREPAFVFYYAGLGAYLLYQRRFIELFLPAHLLAAVITLSIVGIWIWAMIDTAGVEVLIGSSINEVANRGLKGDLQSTMTHLVSYPFEIVLALFPFSLMLVFFLHQNTREEAFKRYGDLLTFALIIATVNFPLYWFTAHSAVRYYLPMTPTLLVVSAVLFTVARTTAPSWLINFSRAVILLVAILSGVLVAYLLAGKLELIELPSPVMHELLGQSLAIIMFIGTVTLAVKSWDGRFTLIVFCSVMILYRVIYYDVLLPRQLDKFSYERAVEQFVQDVYDTVPAHALPIESPATIPHEVWWYMNYGDLTTAPRTYRIQFETEPVEALAQMNWRGRTIILTQDD